MTSVTPAPKTCPPRGLGVLSVWCALVAHPSGGLQGPSLGVWYSPALLLRGRGEGELGRVRKVRQGLDPSDPLSRPPVSLYNFIRGMQERKGISILLSPGAQGSWEAVGEKHHTV